MQDIYLTTEYYALGVCSWFIMYHILNKGFKKFKQDLFPICFY